MNYWLIKTEPGTWSWDDQLKSAKKTTTWDGVRNYQANNNMKAMKKGDKAFFYHSVNEKRIAGGHQGRGKAGGDGAGEELAAERATREGGGVEDSM